MYIYFSTRNIPGKYLLFLCVYFLKEESYTYPKKKETHSIIVACHFYSQDKAKDEPQTFSVVNGDYTKRQTTFKFWKIPKT